MKKVGKVDIFGTQYTVYLYYNEFDLINKDAKERDDRYNQKSDDRNLDGYCDYMAKEIRVFCDKYTSQEYFEMTLRHEMTHAFLYEIGNTNCDNEEFVDKLSKWVPKLDKIFKDGMELMRNVKLEEK